MEETIFAEYEKQTANYDEYPTAICDDDKYNDYSEYYDKYTDFGIGPS